MYVEKLSNGQYKYIERYKDPMSLKWKRVSVTLEKNDRKSRKLAEEILQDKIDASQNASDVSFLTFKELVTKYLAYQEKNVKISTYTRNKHTSKFLLKAIGKDTLVANISARYIRERFDKYCDINSKKNEYLTRLKALLRWGYQNDYIDTVEYLDKLTPYQTDSKRVKLEDKYLEAAEIKLLLDDMRKTRCPHWVDMTEFLILSGLRIGEAIALEKSDISNGHISVTKTYDKIQNEIRDSPKTEMSNRNVYIQDELQKVLDRIYTHNRMKKVTGKFLFCNSKGDHVNYDTYRKFLREHSEKVLGRRITPHALRHTHASLLIAKGIDIEAISRRLGHTNSRITKEIYIHIMEELKEYDKKQLKKLKLI